MKKVYHAKNFSLNSLLHFDDVEIYNPFKEDYELVAVVNCEHVGETFQLTNSIERGWWENEEVCFVKDADGARSTSVGDLVEDESGKLFLCCSIGWKEVVWNSGLKSNDPWWLKMYQKYNDLTARV